MSESLIEDVSVRPVEPRTNDDSGLLTTAFREPSLRWRLEAERTEVTQQAYEIQVSPAADFGYGTVSSGKVAECSRPEGKWPAAPLHSREVAWCRVRVWTDQGVTCWSRPLRIEGGLFEPQDWSARPISPSFNTGETKPGSVPLLRRQLAIGRKLERAILYVTALGVYDFWINGHPVSADLFEPGWTAYQRRLLYSAYDVTALLEKGDNVLAAAVGDGWWRGNLTWMNRRGVYGDTTALIAQLELQFADGTSDRIVTDRGWRGGAGALRAADFYDGCDLDLTLGGGDWRARDFDDSGWNHVDELELPGGLEQRSAPPVRVVKTIPVVPHQATSTLVSVDCGQNLTGYLRLSVRSTAGGRLRVRHAEVLESDGSLHTSALRNAKATDSYRIPAGRFQLSPSFTYHGFRYAEIELSAGVELQNVEVCVVSTDLVEIGEFACSDPRLDKLYANIKWSQRGNFLALPTDCPQRDERLGWTGDIQVFAPSACANFDCRAFLASWLVDLAIEQRDDGQVPSVVPNVISGHEFEYGGIGWADAATLVPWSLYEAYGDRDTLARQFESMRRWVDWGASRLSEEGVWLGDFHLGDWLDPNAPPDHPERALTDRDFIASAYLVMSAGRLAQTARILGQPALAENYEALSSHVATGTWLRWREAARTSQTGCAIAIEFGIAPSAAQPELGACLARLIEDNGSRIGTGFLGTPLVLPALTRTGQIEAAFKLLLNESSPGWLYQVLHGATTMWERWDAILPDGSIHGGEMSSGGGASMISFNHYAYGAVAAWLYHSLAGIAPSQDGAGYHVIDFAPCTGGGISWARASIRTPFGGASVSWKIDGNELAVELAIPPGATGRFHRPKGWMLAGSDQQILGSGRHTLSLLVEPRPPT